MANLGRAAANRGRAVHLGRTWADSEEPLRPGACSRELELREFRDRYVIRSLDGGAAFAVARSGGCIRPLSPGQPLNG